MSSLCCYYQNVRGLRSKTDDLLTSSFSSPYNLIMLTETWLTPSISNSEIFAPRYSVHRTDRDPTSTGRSRGGGVLLAYAEGIECEVLDTSHFSIAIPLIDIIVAKCVGVSFSYYVVVLYIPPDLHLTEFSLALDMLEQLVADSLVLIVGDFNVPSFGVGSNHREPRANRLIDFAAILNLQQYNCITNALGRTLDLVFSNICGDLSVQRDLIPLVAEDAHHPALFFDMPLKVNVGSSFSFNGHRRYDFRRADYISLYSDLLLVDWSFLEEFQDADAALDEFYRVLYSVFDRSVPVSAAAVNPRFPPWFTAPVRRLLELKRHYHRRWKTTGRQHHREDFNRVRRQCKREIDNAYKNYVHRVQRDISLEPSNFWKFVHSKTAVTRIPGRIRAGPRDLRTPQDIVDGFAGSFSGSFLPTRTAHCEGDVHSLRLPISGFLVDCNRVRGAMLRLRDGMTTGDDGVPSFIVRDCAFVLDEPLAKIFNMSLRTCVFPERWRISRICPVFKKGDKDDIANYRPIAIISNFAKVFESVIYSTLLHSVRPYISPAQHGFLPKRSTVTNLAIISQEIAEVIDGGGQLDVIYTDFSRAFDTIDHQILLEKLSNFGFCPALVRFFGSYLCNRKNYVYYNGYRSHVYVSTSGVPQGSNLGPLLFNLFINDLLDAMECQVLAYADDIKLYRRISADEDVGLLQRDLDVMSEWCEANNLRLNIAKCCYVNYTRKQNIFESIYSINGTFISQQTSMRDLGVVFDQRYTFVEHVHTVAASACRTLGFIMRTCRSFDNVRAMKTLYFAFVVSRLEYASIIWYPIYQTHSQRIERIQRRFLKFLSYKEDGTYPEINIDYGILLDRHGFVSLRDRRVKCSGLFAVNLINYKIDCADLLAKINFYVPRQSSRSTKSFAVPVARTNALRSAPMFHSVVNGQMLFSDI